MHDPKKFPLFPLGLTTLLLGAAASQARPLPPPLLPPPSLGALLALPPGPPAAPPLPPPPLLLPRLPLTDWQHVFDIAALGAFDVPLRDDPGERANILLSASAVDGLTLAPGAEFSFNAAVGERTPGRGFRDGLMFDQGRVVRGTGGGICLVATGLYDAALQAGLAITERHPHSGLVSYAAPGCDAGISYGSEDLKFVNTTAFPLVIQARADGDRVAVRLFGHTPPPGSQVIVKPLSLSRLAPPTITMPDPLLPPGQTVVDQKPRAGYSVVLGRFWTRKGRVVRREIVTSETRAPRPEIVRAGPVPVPGPTPAQAPTLPNGEGKELGIVGLDSSPSLLGRVGAYAGVGPDD